MKDKIVFIAVMGCVSRLFILCPGSAQAQGTDSLLGGIIKSMGSSQQDKSRDDSRHYRDSRDDRNGADEDRRRDERPRRDDDDDRYYKDGKSDPDQIVRRAYEDVLNREPDREGLRVYRSRIIDDKWSERDVRDDLRKSAERNNLNAESVDKVIRRAYQDVLGRDPDSSGFATYRDKMMNNGWSERDVRSDLKKSSERRETASSEQAQQIVQRAYRNTLGRDADGGSSVYVEKVMRNHWNEGDVSKELRNSPEYRNKHKK